MKLGTHMPDGERRKPIDIEVCKTKVNELRARSIFQHFGGHFENHSQIGNSGSSVNIHLVGKN
jgi:hypothetical protein